MEKMTIFSEKGRVLLKNIVKQIIKTGRYQSTRPRAFFSRCVLAFKDAGGEINTSKSLIYGYKREEEVFLEIIGELGIEVKDEILGRHLKVVAQKEKPVRGKSVVTRGMLSGARGAQAHHDGVLKYDL
ncbi:hypothetical protein KKF19_00245 [Patescibacteria group bacterium]|nr:hypothetical protein [Patescibacteria group bacterium]